MLFWLVVLLKALLFICFTKQHYVRVLFSPWGFCDSRREIDYLEKLNFSRFSSFFLTISPKNHTCSIRFCFYKNKFLIKITPDLTFAHEPGSGVKNHTMIASSLCRAHRVNMETHPVIGITMGDPVGIGPEIVLKALSDKSLYDICHPLVLGDIQVLALLNASLGTGLALRAVKKPEQAHYQPGVIDVVGLSSLAQDQLQPGHPTLSTGRAMVDYITKGIDWAMQGSIHALATSPINKHALSKAGFRFEGHTELLAERTKTSNYVMMLAGAKLRVALVTIHIPFADISRRLSRRAIIKTIDITQDALMASFGVSEPRLAVAGLNPHGGEQGLFGNEEIEIIAPAIEEAKKAGVNVSGPYPPDTLFYWASQGRWDAVVAMYHDQGLIPFKMIHFTDGVNTTLGLPFVRTSVDHGTAYDIAGLGKAEPGSLVAAITMAAEQAKCRQNIP